MVSIDDYNEVKECNYKEEHYSVRDNGAVLRHQRSGKRKRPLDEKWTFGNLDVSKGYLYYGGVGVHRIVATAFLGEAPSDQHVVDHKDTNRQNNRPENLQWVTKLENALKNPITRKKIELICGSIEAFLENPQLLWGYETEDNNFFWMRNATKEEAQNCLENWSRWAETAKPNPEYKKSSHQVGDWIFDKPKDKSQVFSNPYMNKVPDNMGHYKTVNSPLPKPKETTVKQIVEKDDGSKPSLTPNAVQFYWRVQSEFPCCPVNPVDKPLSIYKDNLTPDAVFCKNECYTSLVVDSVLIDDSTTLLVMTRSASEAVKPWALAKVVFEDGVYKHYNYGSFFEEKGALKYFALEQGKEWTGGDCMDDYCD